MRIKKFQGGGIAYLPTTSRRGAANQAASTSSEENKVSEATKKLMALASEYGIDSDVSVFIGQVEQILNTADDPTGNSLTFRDLLKAEKLANRVRVNYKDYEKARTSLDSQDAWGEVATDRRGRLYVQNIDNGELELVSIEDIKDKTDKYQILTNEDVMNIRRTDRTLAYRNDILDDLSAAVGTTTIIEYANKLIKEFGKTTLNGYTTKQGEKIKRGLELLVAGDQGDFRKVLTGGPDGVYKISTEATVADTGLAEATQYLISAMPRTYRNALNAKAAAEGYTPSALLATAIMTNTDRTIDPKFESEATKALGLGASSGGSEKLQDHDNLAIRFSRGDGNYTKAYISLRPNLKSDRAYMEFTAMDFGSPQKRNGDPVERNNIAIMLNDIFQLEGVDKSSMSFANQVIDITDASKLVWDGQSHIKWARLPKKMAPNGSTVPDFSVMEELNKINELIANNPGLTELEINNELQKMESAYMLEKDPKNPKKYKIRDEFTGVFATFAAIGNDSVLELSDSSKQYVEEIPRDRGKEMRMPYDNYVQYGKAARSRKDKKINDFDDSSSGGFYKGNIYIAMNDPMLATIVTKDQNFTKETFTNYNDKYRMGQMVQEAQAVPESQRPRTNF